MDETPHNWRVVDLTVDDVKGSIRQAWCCCRCQCFYYGNTPPTPFEKVRTAFRNDPDWMQELSCDEAIAKQVMVS